MSTSLALPHDSTNDLDLLLTYHEAGVTYQLNVAEASTNAILQLPKTYINNFRYHVLGQKYLRNDFYRLAPTSGYLEPGSSTIILSPPGAGRSTLLKLVSQMLPHTNGDIFFNGKTVNEAMELDSTDVHKMLTFVDQVDNHFMLLSVQETLNFTIRVLTKKPSKRRVDTLIKAFGMEECEFTLCGSLSGGQKRRLSLMIGLCNPHLKLIAIDNLSDGLDHATTLNIVNFIQNWARENKTIFICSMQQPAPQIFDSFDRAILLREGYTVYNGPVVDVVNFLTAMGYEPPLDVELPEFICYILTHPTLFLKELAMNEDRIDEPLKIPSKKNGKNQITLSTSMGPLKMAVYPCITVEEMVEFYKITPFYRGIIQVLDKVTELRKQKGLVPLPHQKTDKNGLNDNNNNNNNNHGDDQLVNKSPQSNNDQSNVIASSTLTTLAELPPISTPNSSQYYGPGYALPAWQLFQLVLQREVVLNWRNRAVIFARLVPCTVIGLVFGALYFQLGKEEYTFRAASMMDTLTELAFSNLVQLGLLIYARQMIHSQLRLYPTMFYAWSVFLGSIMSSLVECLILFLWTYFMIGDSPYGLSIIGHYAILWIHGLVLTSIFRFMASLSANVSMSYAIVSPLIAVLSLSAGFYVHVDKLPVYLRWIHYITPFSFGWRSLSQLEFLSPRYDYIISDPQAPGQLIRAGHAYLALNNISTDPSWIMWSVFYCLGMITILVSGSAYFLYDPYKEYSIGTRRFDTNQEDEEVLFD
jgi:ABC-type multidrug transport system ATPase subunit